MNKKCGSKQNPEICTHHNNAVGEVDIYLISICDAQYDQKKYEKILPEALLPLVRFDSFQLNCNIQEIWWHTNALQFHTEKCKSYSISRKKQLSLRPYQ
jgi:hypothetical protein